MCKNTFKSLFIFHFLFNLTYTRTNRIPIKAKKASKPGITTSSVGCGVNVGVDIGCETFKLSELSSIIGFLVI